MNLVPLVRNLRNISNLKEFDFIKGNIMEYFYGYDKVIASNYELYNLQSTFQRFLYTLLNEKFISLFPLFSSLFFKFLANQRQDKYSLAHAHSTDALIHTYGQYGCSAFSAVYTDAIN